MMRRGFRRKRQVFWMGNANGGAQAGSVLNPSAAGESPFSFRLELWTQQVPTLSVMQDVIEFDARIERIVGQFSLTTRQTVGTANNVLWRVTAGIGMQEFVPNAAGSWQAVTGATDNLGEMLDMHSLSTAGQNYYVLQRRWLWLKRWVLADPSNIPAQAIYPLGTDSFSSVERQGRFDIKPRVRMQFENRARSIFAPVLWIWGSQFNATSGTATLELDDLFYRVLYSRGSAVARR